MTDVLPTVLELAMVVGAALVFLGVAVYQFSRPD